MKAAEVTPGLLLAAYAQGYFPMARSRRSRTLEWYHPEVRGVLPLDSFHIPRSLARDLRKKPFELRINTAFEQVMLGCAGRKDTWISDAIIELYGQLHRLGHAHSVECYRDGRLAGGLYGVSLGGAFFGESMFSRETNASKAALVHLVSRLRECGFTLLDTQYQNKHIAQFGVVEIPRGDYLRHLQTALKAAPKPFWP